MPCYTTKSSNPKFSYRNAIFDNISPDGGLFLPYIVDMLPEKYLTSLKDKSIQEIAFDLCWFFLKEELDKHTILTLAERAFSFDSPLVYLDEHLAILELFHGPTYAFKDFGARFLSELMQSFKPDKKEVKILVATSGDTGGAVASGFYNKPGFSVYILYPDGKVSPFQLRQIQQYQNNIHCFPVKGTFDDCQQYVKKALSDQRLHSTYSMSTANSINVARLMAQAVYYFRAVAQLNSQTQASFYIPSGNLGNVSSCLLAANLGLPMREVHICQNINNPMSSYLMSGKYFSRNAVPTLSNAMDVGNPNNIDRVIHYIGSTWNNQNKKLTGHTISDRVTKETIVQCQEKFDYLLDPHTAVAAASTIKNKGPETKIILGTAHWVKFKDQFSFYDKFSEPHAFPAPSLPLTPIIRYVHKYEDFYNILTEV